MPKPYVVESAHFHVDAIGLTLFIEETPLGKKKNYRSTFELKAEMAYRGTTVSVGIPLSSLEIAGWLYESLGRVIERMERQADGGRSDAMQYSLTGNYIVRDGKKDTTEFSWAEGLGLDPD